MEVADHRSALCRCSNYFLVGAVHKGVRYASTGERTSAAPAEMSRSESIRIERASGPTAVSKKRNAPVATKTSYGHLRLPQIKSTGHHTANKRAPQQSGQGEIYRQVSMSISRVGLRGDLSSSGRCV